MANFRYGWSYHGLRLSPEEEILFRQAILKKYGKTRGNVETAIREAIRNWSQHILCESIEVNVNGKP